MIAGKLNHKNHEILVRENGMFWVKELEKEFLTFEQAKGAIDRVVKVVQSPTKALMFSNSWSDEGGDVREVTATSIQPSHYRGFEVWVSSIKGKARSKENYDHVYEDTPGNRKLMAEVKGLNTVIEKTRKQIEKHTEALTHLPIPKEIKALKDE